MILQVIADPGDAIDMLAEWFGFPLHHSHPRLLLLPAPAHLSGAMVVVCANRHHANATNLLSVN